MREFLLLSKVLFKNNYNFSFRSKQGKKGIALFVLIVVCMVPFFGMVFTSLLNAFLLHFADRLLLTTIFAASSFFVIWSALFLFPSIFYFSKDTVYLLPLPLKPVSIVLAKTFMVFLSTLAMSCLLLLPAAAAWLLTHPFSILELLFWILGLSVLSLIPLSLSGILILVIMRFLPAVRNKDRFNMILGILTIPFAALAGIASSSLSDIDLASLLSGNTGAFSLFNAFFFYCRPLADAIIDHSLFSFLLYLLMAAAALVLFLYLAQHLYLAAATTASVQAPGRKKKTDLKKEKSRTVFLSLLISENRRLIRSPSYFTNCVLSALIMPVIMTVMVWLNTDFSGSIVLDLPVGQMISAALLAGAAAGFFMSGMSQICSTTFSREGSQLPFLFYTPMKFSVIVHAKLMLGMLYGLGSTALLLIPLHLALTYPIWYDLLFLAGAAFGALVTNQIGLMIDGIHPKLVWDDETTAIKNNLNVVFEMLLTWLLLALCAIPAFLFGSMETLWLLTIALYAVFLLFSAALEFFSLRFLPDSLKKRMAS